MEEADFKE